MHVVALAKCLAYDVCLSNPEPELNIDAFFVPDAYWNALAKHDAEFQRNADVFLNADTIWHIN